MWLEHLFCNFSLSLLLSQFPQTDKQYFIMGLMLALNNGILYLVVNVDRSREIWVYIYSKQLHSEDDLDNPFPCRTNDRVESRQRSNLWHATITLYFILSECTAMPFVVVHWLVISRSFWSCSFWSEVTLTSWTVFHTLFLLIYQYHVNKHSRIIVHNCDRETLHVPMKMYIDVGTL